MSFYGNNWLLYIVVSVSHLPFGVNFCHLNYVCMNRRKVIFRFYACFLGKKTDASTPRNSNTAITINEV